MDISVLYTVAILLLTSSLEDAPMVPKGESVASEQSQTTRDGHYTPMAKLVHAAALEAVPEMALSSTLSGGT